MTKVDLDPINPLYIELVSLPIMVWDTVTSIASYTVCPLAPITHNLIIPIQTHQILTSMTLDAYYLIIEMIYEDTNLAMDFW